MLCAWNIHVSQMNTFGGGVGENLYLKALSNIGLYEKKSGRIISFSKQNYLKGFDKITHTCLAVNSIDFSETYF